MSFLDKFLESVRLNDDFDDDDDLFDDDDIDDEEPEEEEKKEKKKKKGFFRKKDKDDVEEEDDLDDLDGLDDLDDLDDLNDPFEKTKSTRKKSAASEGKTKTRAKQTSTRTRTSSSKVTPMRASKRTGGSSLMEVCVIKPISMEDTREIADTLLAHCTVVLNLEGIDIEIAQRIIDFSSGSCYSLGGGLQKISSYIFILTPDNVEVSGDIQEILSGAFELPPIRTNF